MVQSSGVYSFCYVLIRKSGCWKFRRDGARSARLLGALLERVVLIVLRGVRLSGVAS